MELKWIGHGSRIPRTLKTILIEKSSGSTRGLGAGPKKLVLTLALNYGGRAEITAMVKHVAREIQDGKLDADDITEEVVDDLMAGSFHSTANERERKKYRSHGIDPLIETRAALEVILQFTPQIYSSAQVVSSDFPIFFCGSVPTPNYTFRMYCGRILAKRSSCVHLRCTLRGKDGLVSQQVSHSRINLSKAIDRNTKRDITKRAVHTSNREIRQRMCQQIRRWRDD